MKGLMLKDLYLLKDSRMLVVIVFTVCILFTLINSNSSLSFVVSFVTLIMSMLVITTISYDDFDHSISFLMTLPVTRTLYVREKYGLGFLFAGCGWAVSTLLITIVQALHVEHLVYETWFLEVIPSLLIAVLCISLMIPVQLKFGGDKGRIALIGCILVLFLIGAGIVALCNFIGIDIEQIVLAITHVDILFMIGAVFVISLICVFISYLVTLRIMLKKQF